MGQSRLKRRRKQWLHDFRRDHIKDIEREEKDIREQLKTNEHA